MSTGIKLPIESRQSVFAAISEERDFQDKGVIDPSQPQMIELQMGSILAAIEVNLRKAQGVWYTEAAPYAGTTNYLRKIAALAVQAGEAFGMTQR